MPAKIVDIDAFTRILGALSPAIHDAMVRGLQSAALRLDGFVKQEIDVAQPFPAVDRGELKASVKTNKVSDGAEVEVQAPHAAIIEEGTRPFRPPPEPLQRWAMRKFGVTEKEAKRVAWLVGSAIARNGIAPRRYFAKAWNRVQPVIRQEIRRELQALASRR